jgi:hypothetical protein
MRIHLVSTAFPIKAEQPQTADCGVWIEKAQICCVWDEQEMMQGMPFSRNICSACYLLDTGTRGKMLIYGITERRQDEQSTDTP